MLRRVLFFLPLLVSVCACAHKGPWESAMSQGRHHLEKERYEQARQSYGRALELRPGNPEALMGRAAAEIGLKRLPQALADMNAAIAVKPRLQWRSRRGMLLYAMGKYPEALLDLDAVLAAHPHHAPSRAARGMVNIKMHRCANAAADFRIARKRGIPIPQEWERVCTPPPKQADATDSQESSPAPQ